MAVTKQQFIECARTYVGTPFHHQGRRKGVGLDCVGLPICVAAELGLSDKHGAPFAANDYPGYSEQPTDGFVHQECMRRLIIKSIAEVAPGDVVTLKVPSVPCHVAVVSEFGGQLYMIHSYNDGSLDRVVEHIMSPAWQRRIVGCFSIPGVE